MHFSLAVVSNLLLASSVLARPSGKARYAERVARRNQVRTLKSQPLIKSGTASNINNTEYSENWSGAVIETAPDGEYWHSVTAQFTVPVPKGSADAAASAWVGIDGDTCETAILQTGVDFTVDGGYDAWYEWYPAYAYDFTLDISAGDVIKTTVTATSFNTGSAVIENLTTGQTVTKELESSSDLCLENAEWIVEDFEEGDSLVPFADFGSINFLDAVATTNEGTTVGPDGGITIDIENDDGILTSVDAGPTAVKVTYL